MKKILVRDCAKPKTAKSIRGLLHKYQKFCQRFGQKNMSTENYAQINGKK